MNPARFGRACVIAGCLGAAPGIAVKALAGGNAPNMFGYIDRRFDIGLGGQERSDLVAFLRAL